MTQYEITNEYFEYLYGVVCKQPIYRKLLMRLHDIEFRYSIARDKNQAEHGKSLRYRFAMVKHSNESPAKILDCLTGPCSVLEMMVAIAIYCEESIMDNPHIGDRTSQWFWGMVVNLGLGSMTDTRFNKQTVDDAINKFLNRDYDPDGKGGLFRIRNCHKDLRDVEILYQLYWYLDTIPDNFV